MLTKANLLKNILHISPIQLTFSKLVSIQSSVGVDIEKMIFKIDDWLKYKPLPPLPEQQKIAEILGSVVHAIALTQAVIDQTHKVKQGLLQQLLTRGEYEKRKIDKNYRVAARNPSSCNNAAQMARVGKAETMSQVVKTLKQRDTFWLIFIDQFEELFTVSDPEKRDGTGASIKSDRFVEGLVNLSQERANDQLIKVIATIRADFLDRLDPYPVNLLARATQSHRPFFDHANVAA